MEGSDFERWLQQELQHQAVGKNGPSPMAAQARYHAAYLQGGAHVSVLAKALVKVATAISAKGAIGLTIATLAVGGAGAGAVITGSPHLTDWGQQVVQQIRLCKDALAPNSHGIGKCVSTYASKHGNQVSSEHAARGAERGTRRPATPPAPPTSHPTGLPASHAHPDNHPGGRPGTP